MSGESPTVVTPHPPQPRMPAWAVALVAIGALLVIGLLVVIILLITGSDSDQSPDTGTDGSSPAEAETFLVTGSITLTSANINYASGECWGEEGYDDMSGGAQVVVRDNTGATVAVGQLDTGIKESSVVCRFDFSVEDVPSGSPAYSLEVTHRGEFSFTEEEASGIHLSLG